MQRGKLFPRPNRYLAVLPREPDENAIGPRLYTLVAVLIPPLGRDVGHCCCDGRVALDQVGSLVGGGVAGSCNHHLSSARCFPGGRG